MPLLASPREWVEQLEVHVGHAAPPAGMAAPPYSRVAYLRTLAGLLTGSTFKCDMLGPWNQLLKCLHETRLGGAWGKPLSPYSVSMAGHARMWSLDALIGKVKEEGVSGSYAEAGVWRGGMSIFGVAALQLYGMADRPVYLCDSFQGLPPPRQHSLRPDEGQYQTQHYLRVGQRLVLGNFEKYGVPHDKVTPIAGYFVHSMPKFRAALQARNERLAILRMDGDMYDSTIDILYNLYDLVQVGGYVIIDDLGWAPMRAFGARDAVLDFRALHGIEDEAHSIVPSDLTGAYFRKAREVTVRHDVYARVLNMSTSRAEARSLLRPDNMPPFHKMLASWESRMGAEALERHKSLVQAPPVAGPPTRG